MTVIFDSAEIPLANKESDLPTNHNEGRALLQLAPI